MGMTSVKFHRMGASCSAGRRDGGVLGRDAVRVLELSACPHPSPPRPPGTTRDRKRRLSSVASGQGHHQLCLCSKASIKAPNDRDSRSFQVGNTSTRWEVVAPEVSMGALCPFPHTLPEASLPSSCSQMTDFLVRGMGTRISVNTKTHGCSSPLCKMACICI